MDVARAYTLTIWGIALGILIFAVGVVAWALAIANTQLFKDGVDWVYDVALYGIAAIVFGRDARAERLAALAIGAVMAIAACTRSTTSGTRSSRRARSRSGRSASRPAAPS
jgi:uncharacterized oligopeptide transporter (OPT) family protein